VQYGFKQQVHLRVSKEPKRAQIEIAQAAKHDLQEAGVPKAPARVLPKL